MERFLPPVDPVYWKRVILDRVDRAMKLLSDTNKYAVDGVIIDPSQNVRALSGGSPGDADYGQFAFNEFLKETQHAAPDNLSTPAARQQWLSQQHFDQAYLDWQFNRNPQLRDAVAGSRPRLPPQRIAGLHSLPRHALVPRACRRADVGKSSRLYRPGINV